MVKTWRISVVVVAVVVLGCAGWLVLQRNEPEYQGKTARQWFRIAVRQNSPEAIAALLKLGSNAVPALADNLKLAGSKEPNPWERSWSKLPLFLRKHIPQPLSPVEASEKAREIIRQLPVHLRRDVAALAVPALIRRFEDRTLSGRAFFLASYILEVEPDIRLIGPVLYRALDDPDAGVRVEGIIGLQQYHLTKDNIPRLVKMLDDPDPDVRRWAIFALGRLGPAAKPVVPALEKFLSNDDDNLHREAAYALWRIDRQTNAVLAVATNVDVLRYDQEAVGILAEMGDAGKVAIPALLIVAKSPDNTVEAPPHRYDLFMEDVIRFACCRTIRKLDPTQDAAILPVLIQMIENRRADKLICSDVLDLLSKMGPGAAPALASVQRLLNNSDPKVRAAAEKAVKSIGVEAGHN